MECPNCTFQNIPGTRTCVRCSTLLDFSAVDIDPPRAASGRLGRQTRAVALSSRAALRGAAVDVARALRLPSMRRLGLFDYANALVPGLPQIRSRPIALRALGWMILGAWAAVLLLALLTVGSGASTLLCFAAISIHSFSAALMLAPEMQDAPFVIRMVLGISLYFAVMAVVYVPGYVVAQRIAVTVPIAGLIENPVIANGDVLLRTGAWTGPAAYQRGDLVLTTVEATFPGGHGQGVMVAGGFNADRVVAVAGDEVVIRKGVLTVNGAEPPPELRPIGGAGLLPDCEFQVGEGTVVVFPSALLMNRYLHGRIDLFMRISTRSREEVLGRVFFRLRPWSRMGVPTGEGE